ncbi:hypothetical protein N9F73_00540 [bacterium]|nr:hypothetical protein [bacterium]
MANSDHRILYKSVEGVLIIVSPADNCGLTVQEIADKDVPTGHPYKIVLTSELNLDDDDDYRNAWTCEDSILTDGVGGEHGVDADAGCVVPLRNEDGSAKTQEVLDRELKELLYGVAPK